MYYMARKLERMDLIGLTPQSNVQKRLNLGTNSISSYEVRGSTEEDYEFHLLNDHLIAQKAR